MSQPPPAIPLQLLYLTAAAPPAAGTPPAASHSASDDYGSEIACDGSAFHSSNRPPSARAASEPSLHSVERKQYILGQRALAYQRHPIKIPDSAAAIQQCA